jgi:hypothetical protein
MSRQASIVAAIDPDRRFPRRGAGGDGGTTQSPPVENDPHGSDSGSNVGRAGADPCLAA